MVVRYSRLSQVAATAGAFALWCPEGLIAWGHPMLGGRKPVELSTVQHIKGGGSAFAAILTDGSVETWGDPEMGVIVPKFKISYML